MDLSDKGVEVAFDRLLDAEIGANIAQAVIKGRGGAALEAVEAALSSGASADSALSALLSGMDVVGERFKSGKMFVPEVMAAAKAFASCAERLKGLLAAEGGGKTVGRAVIGTVKGDRHDIGKNLVKMMFEGKGVEVTDLGVDVSAERFVAAQKETGARIIACSALLTTTMGEMGRVIELLKEEGLRDNVVVMVGGAPVTEEFRRRIGADIYAADAASAADAAYKALKKRETQGNDEGCF